MADKTLMTVLTVALAMKGALPGECYLIPARVIYFSRIAWSLETSAHRDAAFA